MYVYLYIITHDVRAQTNRPTAPGSKLEGTRDFFESRAIARASAVQKRPLFLVPVPLRPSNVRPKFLAAKRDISPCREGFDALGHTALDLAGETAC